MGLIVTIKDIDAASKDDKKNKNSNDDELDDEEESDEVTEEKGAKDKGKSKKIRLTDFTITKYNKRSDESEGKNEYLEKDLLGIELYGKINVYDKSKEILAVNDLAKWSKVTAHEKEAYKDVKIKFFDNNNEVYDKLHFKNGFVVEYKEGFDYKNGNGEFYVFIREFRDKIEASKKINNTKSKPNSVINVGVKDSNKFYATATSNSSISTLSDLDLRNEFESYKKYNQPSADMTPYIHYTILRQEMIDRGNYIDEFLQVTTPVIIKNPKAILLKCGITYISENRKQAINKINKYYSMVNEVRSTMDQSDGINIFAFEGVGAYAVGGTNDAHRAVLGDNLQRYGAMMIVMKGKDVIYITPNASTISDWHPNSFADDRATNISDGTFQYYTGTHSNEYTALLPTVYATSQMRGW